MIEQGRLSDSLGEILDIYNELPKEARGSLFAFLIIAMNESTPPFVHDFCLKWVEERGQLIINQVDPFCTPTVAEEDKHGYN